VIAIGSIAQKHKIAITT